jgi:UDP-N-acetylglucosamine diphosphorylase / glucose-1-phosphate thymidylyltransferase / UDP-N-acetylgalactosamine diphosphorylase / glucosamine-1-phosphate N-acetyltransferase / galactosamine-1-phosphate N-acetyltransferase
MQAADLFALPPSLVGFAAHFDPTAAPWAWVDAIGRACQSMPSSATRAVPGPGLRVEGEVWLGAGVRLPAQATLIGPAWIGAGTEIRPGAYVRGNVITGAGCVLGNSCEFKNCLLLDHVQVPHFSYVGDSVLGNGTHLGAGAICSNLRLDQQPVAVRLFDGATADSGRRKLGALLGDQAEVGCNAVLNPGTILGRRALVMPGVIFTGTLAPAMIAKTRISVQTLPRRD